MKRGVLLILLVLVLACSIVLASPAANVSSPFKYTFNSPGILYESGSMDTTTSPYFWLNSGAKLNISYGIGRTIQKELSSNDKWRLLYASSNPVDTDNGYHPQNIFRLITRSRWENITETSYFRVTRDQLSSSPNRAASNGLLLMSRYKDGNNLYYSGIRVDGYSIIKKKINGKYYTLASKKILSGTYNRDTNPNLIPKNVWIGLKSQIKNVDGKVNIKIYMDKGRTGNWTLIAEANDDGRYGSLIKGEGYAGIRTDFMDVEFEDFSIIKI